MKKSSSLLLLGVLVAIITGLYTGYLFWQKSVAISDAKKAENALKTAQEEMLQFEGEDTALAIAAKQTLNELQEGVIRWSRIIKKIRATIPKDKNDEPKIEVLSYSGSGKNDISMSVKTVSDSKNPYFDVADLIQSFDESENFEGNFVAAISQGKDLEGSEVLTFNFSTTYVEPAVTVPEVADDSLEESVSDIVNESMDSSEDSQTPISR